METRLKSLLTTLLLGGIWGVFTYCIGSFVLFRLPLTSFLFYPFLFGGIVVVIAFTIESKIQFTRDLVVGLISGFIYQILSPTLPLLSSVLVGASLGGGLAHDEGTVKDIFGRLFSILKGIIFFPVIIYVGGILVSLTSSITDSYLIFWFSWGILLSLTISFIYSPLLSSENSDNDFQTLSDLDEFKTEAQNILTELNQLISRY
ncbi:MAG: hypothetical protein ACRENZ_03210 [Thermodesulfobacteriota bacterium]